ncbi:MAG: OmpA family protein [Paracoccaceae bacterium]|nr:OmpA family protein [Paracoccaceae bacterium]
MLRPLILSALLALPTGALAQDMTAEEILARLERQALGLAKGVEFYPTETADDGYRTMPVEDQVQLRIQFAFDSADILESEIADLAELCTAINATSGANINIIGHTDAAGAEAYNKALSEQRASAVVAHLTGECGVEETQLQAVGVGERHLLEPENPRGDRNRRVEIQMAL